MSQGVYREPCNLRKHVKNLTPLLPLKPPSPPVFPYPFLFHSQKIRKNLRLQFHCSWKTGHQGQWILSLHCLLPWFLPVFLLVVLPQMIAFAPFLLASPLVPVLIQQAHPTLG